MRALLIASVILGFSLSAQGAERLMPDRLYEDPPLEGEAPRSLSLSPDGVHVAYLRPAADDANELELWLMETETGERRRAATAGDLLGGGRQTLSSQELARRERARIRSTGIVSYDWAPDGQSILIPLSGDLFRLDVSAGTSERLTQTEAPELDAKLSPDGRRLAFVRGQNLHVLDLTTGQERALTTQGGGTLTFGAADFLAQEEMSRFEGFWWSPTSSHIAYQRTDESPVGTLTRTEATAQGITTVTQRYPRTGTDNPLISLHVIDVEGEESRELMAFGQNAYMTRVYWMPDGTAVVVERQNRAQTRLEAVQLPIDGGDATTLFTETSDHWVEIDDDLKLLGDGRVLWVEEIDGYRHIRLREPEGEVRTLTRAPASGASPFAGQNHIDRIACVDVRGGNVFFEGWFPGAGRAVEGDPPPPPVQRHLYRIALNADRDSPVALTRSAGQHTSSFAGNCNTYLGRYSSVDQPPRAGLYRKDGTLRRWVEENPVDADHPWQAYADPARTRFGMMEGPDGSPLIYRETLPANFDEAESYPAIILVYGGPHVQTVTDAWGRYPLLARVFADAGYVVFHLDNRGMARRGGGFEAVLHDNLGGPEVEDQSYAARAYAERAYVDGERVGAYGWSYGGTMVLHLLARAGDVFTAGVAGAPVTDWSLYDTHYTERYLDTPQANPQGYRQGSPLTYVDDLKSPLLLVHGMGDDNVIFDNSLKMMQALQENETVFDLMTYPGEPHGLRQVHNRKHFLKTMMAFFNVHLSPDVSPADTTGGQDDDTN